MKTISDIRRETGISYHTLVKYTGLGLIPKPQRVWRGRKGSESWYPDDVVNLINRIKLHQKDRGLSLSEIAEFLGKERAEIEVLKPKEEYLIPFTSEAVQSVLDAYGNFYGWLQEQIEKQKPGYELYSLEMDKVTKDGEEFLKPKVIKVRPRTGKSKEGLQWGQNGKKP